MEPLIEFYVIPKDVVLKLWIKICDITQHLYFLRKISKLSNFNKENCNVCNI